MEFRKLISFGKSSYVVSLPKTWIDRQKLKKGDFIYFNDNGTNLVLSPKLENKDSEDKEIVIPIDNLELKQIKREIISAYIKNYKTIILTGNKIEDLANEIQQIIQSFVALEVMEQTSKKIVAKDFLNMEEISIESIIRKIDIIIRSMMEDCKKMFEHNAYKSINYRDNDVNKLVFLVFRIVKLGFECPTLVSKKSNMTSNDLNFVWLLVSNLEKIADEIKRIARRMESIQLNPKEKIILRNLLKDIEESYLKMIKSYHTLDINSAHKIVNEREALIKRCDEFYQKNASVFGAGLMIASTKSLVVHICHLGRIMYQK